jgi:hypothetical protein
MPLGGCLGRQEWHSSTAARPTSRRKGHIGTHNIEFESPANGERCVRGSRQARLGITGKVTERQGVRPQTRRFSTRVDGMQPADRRSVAPRAATPEATTARPSVQPRPSDLDERKSNYAQSTSGFRYTESQAITRGQGRWLAPGGSGVGRHGSHGAIRLGNPSPARTVIHAPAAACGKPGHAASQDHGSLWAAFPLCSRRPL